MARVQVSDEVWAAYRAGLGATSVSEALGELVRREVGRGARRSAMDAAGVRLALEDARQLRDELEGLIRRLEYARSDAVADDQRLTRYGISPDRPEDAADRWAF
jgi:hypothetical protein